MRLRSPIAVAASLALAACLAHLAFAEEWRTPLEHCSVGEWAKFTCPSGLELRQTVTKKEREGKLVTIRQEVTVKGKKLDPVEFVRDLDKKPDEKSKKNEKWSDGELEVAGKKLKCRVWERETDKIWLCDTVTIEGVVKIEREGKPILELVAWSKAPEDEKPTPK